MAATVQERVAHLLRRAGLGAMPQELAEYTALGYAGAVNRLAPTTFKKRKGLGSIPLTVGCRFRVQ
jgi:hypothetical protein